MTPEVHPEPFPGPSAPSLTWTWPSRIDLKQERIDTVVAAVAAAGRLDDEERSWLVLILDEALVNAMLHGNEGDPGLTIDVRLWLDRERWILAISDRGTGFVPSEVPDQNDPQSLYLEHGRGIRLMQAWLDRLAWHDGGATVVMSRHFPPS